MPINLNARLTKIIRKTMASVVLSSLALSVSAHATTGQELVNLCHGVKSNNANDIRTFHSGACFGYVRSLLETSHMILLAVDQVSDRAGDRTSSVVKSGIKTMRLAYCIPEDGTLWDYVYSYLDYMDLHPTEMDEMAIYSFRRSMSDQYPCQV